MSCISSLSYSGFSPWGFDYKSMTDPVPGRCRRTDGKKWRCSREVISDRKYCERHMHRGRQRSRKHVEASENVSEFISSKTMKSINSMKTTNSSRLTNVNSALFISNHIDIQSATSSQNIGTSILAISAGTTTCVSGSNRNVLAKDELSATGITRSKYGDCKRNISGDRNTPITRSKYGHTADKYKCQGTSDYIDRKDLCYSHITGKNIKKNEKDGNSLATPGFDFSPKSVLQVVGCSSSGIDCITAVGAEVERCRRTDGRKWRCSKNVIPYQKYCEKHMHRGAKRLTVASQQSLDSGAVPPSLATNTQFYMPSRKAVDCMNTNLSIAIAARPQPITKDEDSSTSNSSSDATTITDENASVAYMLQLPP